jgi:hypothetical protein
MDGEREIGVPRRADVLDDHVDVDVRRRDRSENAVRDPGLVLDPHHGDLGLVAVERDAGDDGLFHEIVFLVGDERAL